MGPALGDTGADRRARGAGRACVKRYPAIWAMRSRSNGGDQTEGGGGERLQAALLLFAAVKSPELGQARARGVPGSLEWVREGEDDSANLMAGLWPRDRGQRGENSGEKASGRLE
jgi:hypothetical protein